ncbi:MAG: hypothetical protein Q9220_006182 [cf. Caloplaca sp. 1 TL-2023]
MGFGAFLNNLRKPGIESGRRDGPRLPERRLPIISKPIPIVRNVANHGQVQANEVNPPRLKRTPGIRRPDQHVQAQRTARNIGPVQRKFANLGAEEDLGLQPGPRRLELLRSPAETGQIDSDYTTNLQVGPLCMPKGPVRDRTQHLRPTPGAEQSSKSRVSADATCGKVELLTIPPNGHEYQSPGLFGSVGPRRPGRAQKPIVSRPVLSRQSSGATLCGILSPNGEYKVERSIFEQDFEFVRIVGEGGFGRIELHKHKRTGQSLVLKRTRYLVEHINGVPAEVYFLQNILGNAHANLPHLYHYNSSLAEIHYWMDYCNGSDLLTLMDYFAFKARLVPEGFIWHVLIQVSSALAYMHTGIQRSHPDRPPPPHWQAVVHRDIKPDNIFLKIVPGQKYPDVVLGDFGLATTSLRTGGRKHYIGTCMWQPPQIPYHTITSDIWSAGAIAYGLAMGAPPLKEQPRWDGRSEMEWEMDGSTRQVKDVRVKGYSVHLREMLGEWLHFNEGERPAGLRGCLKAEAGRLLWMADGSVEKDLGSWGPWALSGGAEAELRMVRGAKFFDDE